MKPNRRQIYNIFLILGIVFFAIGLSTDNKVFTWIAIVSLMISLVISGRWFRIRRK